MPKIAERMAALVEAPVNPDYLKNLDTIEPILKEVEKEMADSKERMEKLVDRVKKVSKGLHSDGRELDPMSGGGWYEGNRIKAELDQLAYNISSSASGSSSVRNKLRDVRDLLKKNGA